MSWKHTIPIGLGIGLAVVAAGLVAASMFLTDKGEEMVHLYGDYRSLTRQGQGPAAGTVMPAFSGMEVTGQWRGMFLGALDGFTARGMSLGEVERGVVVTDLSSTTGQEALQSGLQVGDVIVGVDRQSVRDLSDLYRITGNLGPGVPVLVEVQRQGQGMTLVLPGAQTVGLPLPGGQARAEGVPAAWAGQHFYCPRDGLILPQRTVAFPYRCPRCMGPLQAYSMLNQ